MGIRAYSFLSFFASFFNKKAKQWRAGRKNIFNRLENSKFDAPIWFHVSSLGEFEQARPLIEKIKNRRPEQQIILTFFSPSGYEIRKNYDKADFVFYLPIDTKKNAKLFVETVKPSIVFFVKYDFWYNYIEQVYLHKIPIYLVSGIFRENQIFFKKIGKKYAQILHYFTHIFVQDENSEKLLNNLNTNNITIAGDTRFDRVIEISEQTDKIELVENFVGDNLCFIAGSTWLPDEKIITNFINLSNENIKYIIAPHNIAESRILELMQLLKKKVTRFSKANPAEIQNFDVLIIDNIGMLATIYKYAHIGFIGGGFGSGIHNILEAAVYGMPIMFGTNYKKFNEAVEMIELKAAFSIRNNEDFSKNMKMFINNNVFREEVAKKAKDYVYKNKGAVNIIIDFVFK